MRPPNSSPPSLSEKVAQACRTAPLSLVYLFGSHARGTADAESDVDIAVLAAPTLSPQERRALRMDLLTRFVQALSPDVPDVDLIILQDVPILLQYNVIRGGKLIAAAPGADRIGYELDVERRYEDESPALDEQTELTLHRILARRA